MDEYSVKIKSIEKITHDVLRVVTGKPKGYGFTPGQATEISIDRNGWKKEKRPFTFTCLPDDDHLEFTIKTYPNRKSVTDQLLKLKMNDELVLHEVFGAIEYKGEGIFIAGGAGVTPFIAILRYLKSKNKIGGNRLIFANKTKADIIMAKEFKELLGDNFINILSDEKVKGYANGQMTEDFIKTNIDGINKFFYICGPPPMMDAVENQLSNLHVADNLVVKESF